MVKKRDVHKSESIFHVPIDFYLPTITPAPREDAQEEKPNMGLVKLKDMPAIDGYASRETPSGTPLVDGEQNDSKLEWDPYLEWTMSYLIYLFTVVEL